MNLMNERKAQTHCLHLFSSGLHLSVDKDRTSATTESQHYQIYIIHTVYKILFNNFMHAR